MYNITELTALSLEELKKIASKLKIEDPDKLDAQQLVYKVLDIQASKPVSVKKKSSGKRALPSKGKPAVSINRDETGKKEPKEGPEKVLPIKLLPNEKPRSRYTKMTSHQKLAKEDKKNSLLSELEGKVEGGGVLEIVATGYGFLRSADYNYLSSPDDIYIGHDLVKKYGLKRGDSVWGTIKPPKVGDKYFGLHAVLSINGQPPEAARDRVGFEYLTPLFPQEKFNISLSPKKYETRLVDLFSPIGKGQRGMIVAPPKTGKTYLIKSIANGIAQNHPEVYMIVLLIDERPEEVTDMMRSVHAEVIASTFDEHAENHVKVADLVLEKAKRMVESGYDVIIILDGITRLARAHNTVTRSSGKILSGGVDANALYQPKKFFGAARNVENGGSLTIIATALVDTGSKMDEVIFEEFKGTGNMELKLDRRLANRNHYPAIDITESSTRRHDLLQSKEVCQRIKVLRHAIAEMKPVEALEFLLDNIRGTKDNADFLSRMHD